MKRNHFTTQTIGFALAALLPLAGCSSKGKDARVGAANDALISLSGGISSGQGRVPATALQAGVAAFSMAVGPTPSGDAAFDASFKLSQAATVHFQFWACDSVRNICVQGTPRVGTSSANGPLSRTRVPALAGKDVGIAFNSPLVDAQGQVVQGDFDRFRVVVFRHASDVDDTQNWVMLGEANYAPGVIRLSTGGSNGNATGAATGGATSAGTTTTGGATSAGTTTTGGATSAGTTTTGGATSAGTTSTTTGGATSAGTTSTTTGGATSAGTTSTTGGATSAGTTSTTGGATSAGTTSTTGGATSAGTTSTTGGTGTATGGTTSAGTTSTTGGATTMGGATSAGTTSTTGGATTMGGATSAGTTSTTGGATSAGTTSTTTGGATSAGTTSTTTGGATSAGTTSTTGGTGTATGGTTTARTTTAGTTTGPIILPRSSVDYSNVRLVFRDSLDPYGRYKAGSTASAVPKCLGANATIEACDFKTNPAAGSRWNLQQVEVGGAPSGYAVRQVISKSSGLCLEYAPLQIIPTAISNPTYKRGTVSMKACNPQEPRQHFLFSGRGELLTAGPDSGFCVNIGRGLDVGSLKPGDPVGVFMCKTGDASLYDPVP